ncbi:hypothetical protein HS7_20440 [Sulfolobales archaeon HS-7]|nr:hypothetical protein HS7_20440 [Sulfolobales archaeon HS-7]
MDEELSSNYLCQVLNNFRGDSANVYIVQKGNKKNSYRYTVYRVGLPAKDVNTVLLQLFRTNINCFCDINQQHDDENSEEYPAGELNVKRIDDNIYTDDIIYNKNISDLKRELKHKLTLLLYTQWGCSINDIECSCHLFIGVNLKSTRILAKSSIAKITGNFDRIEDITRLEKAIIIPEIGDFLILYEKCGEEVKKFYVKKIESELKSSLEQKFEEDLNLAPNQIKRARDIIENKISSREWSNGVFSRLTDDNGNPIVIDKNEVEQMAENSYIRVHIFDLDTIVWLRYSKTPDILVNTLREGNRLSDILEVKNGKLVVKRTNKVEIVRELLRILRQNYGLPILPSARGVIGSRKGGFVDLVREIIGQNNGEIGRDELKNKLYYTLEPSIKRVLDPDGKSQSLQKDINDLIEIILDVLKNSEINYEDNDKIRLQTRII